jgi:hypothetical protein
VPSGIGGSGAHGAVAVGTTAVLIRPGSTARDGLQVQNVHASQTLYVGTSSGVTVANGIKVAPGVTWSSRDYSGPVWGIADGANTDVRFFEAS